MAVIALANHRENKKDAISIYASILLAIIPVLSPYSVGPIPVTLVLGSLLVAMHSIHGRLMLRIEKKYLPLLVYVLFCFVLSLNGLIILHDVRNLRNSIIMMIVEMIVYLVAWKRVDLGAFIKTATAVAYVACLYALYQFAMKLMGRAIPLGRIPFLQINAGWVYTTWGYRFNSIFSEPSYFAIYLLPIFSYYLFREKWIQAIAFAFFLVLSSSTLGITIMLVMAIWQIVFRKGAVKHTVYRGVVVLLVAAVVLFLFLKIPALNRVFSRTIAKIEDILSGSGNSDIRIVGYLDYFQLLPLKEKIFGVGFSQLQNYFAEHGYSLYNYSNAFVLTLINSGLIGMAVMLGFLINLFSYSVKNKSIPYYLILILIMASDSVNLSYRFYWPLFFVYSFSIEQGRKET